jgi:hypothetical protein
MPGTSLGTPEIQRELKERLQSFSLCLPGMPEPFSSADEPLGSFYQRLLSGLRGDFTYADSPDLTLTVR